MRRRQFIKSTITAAAAIALLPLLPPAPLVLYGDGVHDDTEAIQAILDGKQVAWASGKPVDKVIRGGTFRFSDTLYVERDGGYRFENCHFCFGKGVKFF